LQLKEYTIQQRRDFHRHPELGFQETRTAGIVAKTLIDLGLEVMTGIGKTGVVGMLQGQAESPVLLLRFDMDALPIQEENTVDYISEDPGKMHACGHDSHMAVGLTVAKILAERKDSIPGTIKFVFQPAEEGDGGAELMVAEGVLENPKPDYSLAMHVWNEKPVGWFGLADGPVMAGSEIFKITITGKGGHGASPHHTADPIAASAQIITALQTIISRNVNPLDSAVLSVCVVDAGTAFNIIPQRAVLSGTIRSFKPEVRELVNARFMEIVNGVASAMGCEAAIEITEVTFPVVNAPEVAHIVADVVREVLPDATVDTQYQTMGSEDFSFMMQDIPGCFMFVGSANAEEGLNFGHHHPRFNIDEACLPPAAAVIAQSAITILQKHKKTA
jgi:amidohydrolase